MLSTVIDYPGQPNGKLQCSSPSSGSTIPLLGLNYKVAILEPERVLTSKLQSEQLLPQIKGDPLFNTSPILDSKLSTGSRPKPATPNNKTLPRFSVGGTFFFFFFFFFFFLKKIRQKRLNPPKR